MTPTLPQQKLLNISHFLAHGYINGVTPTLRYKYFIIAHDILFQIMATKQNASLTLLEVIHLVTSSIGKPDVVTQPIYDLVFAELHLLKEPDDQ